jgi:GNAT superfamily N-acetyltransferase
VRCEEIDVDDDEAYAAWFAPIRATDDDLWPNEPGWLDFEVRALARRSDVSTHYLTVARDDVGRVVGAALTRHHLYENLGRANVLYLNVHPGHRRRGVGGELLSYVEARAVAAGKTTIALESQWPFDHAGEEPAASFAPKRGYARVLASSRRRLALPVASEQLARHEDDARPFAEGYEIVTWQGACPDRWLDGRVTLAAGMSTDTPQGELDAEPERWGVERLRAEEAVMVQLRRTRYTVGVVDRRTDELVGFSEIGVSNVAPDTGYQYDTIVADAHRGHRLGVLLKVANLRVVQTASPVTTQVYTWNADANGPMVRVNDLLGFERVGRGSVWQRSLR